MKQQPRPAVDDDPLYDALLSAYDELCSKDWALPVTARSKNVGFVPLPGGRVGQVTISIEADEAEWH